MCLHVPFALFVLNKGLTSCQHEHHAMIYIPTRPQSGLWMCLNHLRQIWQNSKHTQSFIMLLGSVHGHVEDVCWHVSCTLSKLRNGLTSCQYEPHVEIYPFQSSEWPVDVPKSHTNMAEFQANTAVHHGVRHCP